MKIAIVNNNWGDFHPDTAIGIGAVIRDVARGLMKNGHEVTVFSSSGSVFPGVHLVRVGLSLKAQGLHLFHEKSPQMQSAYMQKVVEHLVGFDVVHNHAEHVLLPFVEQLKTPVVSTVHGAGFAPREQAIFEQFPNYTYIALSHGAKKALPYIHFSDVVYNGIDIDKAFFYPVAQPPGYLAWMGRFSQNKGALDAIAASRGAGDVLTLIGFEEHGQEAYFAKIQEQVDGAQVRLLDMMIGDKRYSHLGNAKALLFPIHWEEPFGLVMIEAMACGTPVIAYNRGSVSEIVKDGVTGFIVDEKAGVPGLVAAIKKIDQIDRAACRRYVEENFTIGKMVAGYETVYTKILAR